MRGRTTVGTDNGAHRVTANNTLGANGGEEKHLLTISEMPSHSHSIQYQKRTRTLGGNSFYDAELVGNSDSTANTQLSGNDQSHNNMQPYLVLNYIIKTGQEEADNQLNKTAQRDRDTELDNQRNEIAQLKKKLETMDQLEQKLSALEMASAKAWVVFNGTNATILDSYNIASVARNDTGKYTINFLKPFNSENYCHSLHSGSGASLWIHTIGPFYEKPTRTTFKFFTCAFNGVLYDAPFVSACFYGKQ